MAGAAYDIEQAGVPQMASARKDHLLARRTVLHGSEDSEGCDGGIPQPRSKYDQMKHPCSAQTSRGETESIRPKTVFSESLRPLPLASQEGASVKAFLASFSWVMCRCHYDETM